jgi:CheY-like chemotaxis protein
MSGERIMVVCEQSELRDSITQLIENHGLESYPAADGIDALRQIYHVRPQVIISDAALSQLSGFQFLPFVRRRFPTAGVIALAGAEKSHEVTPVADMLVAKDPWNPEHFIGHVRHLLSRWPLRSDVEEFDCA